MIACDVCGEEFARIDSMESHRACHGVLPVKRNPLSYLVVLPDGITSGRMEAAEAFADGYAELARKHPDTRFDFFPFSYATEGQGCDPALQALLAVSLVHGGTFLNPDGQMVEWACGSARPPGEGWVDQHPERNRGEEKCWHRILDAAE